VLDADVKTVVESLDKRRYHVKREEDRDGRRERGCIVDEMMRWARDDMASFWEIKNDSNNVRGLFCDVDCMSHW
jgi:hypothetical protein